MDDRPIAAPERFVIILEGKLWNVHRRDVIVPAALPHLLARLLTGETVNAAAFAAFGIRLTIEECGDQGEDGADELVVPRR